MARRSLRRRTSPDITLSPEIAGRLRELLPRVGEDVVTAIIAEVPSYQDALSGAMGETIRTAVGVALGGFLSVASGQTAESVPATPEALEGAYELGRGEARSGRTTEALLAAYRIGARVAWRELSSEAVAAGLPPEALVEFAALVFAWIDEVSDASVAGHGDELATTGRVRQRLLERLVRQLLGGATAEVLDDAVERAGWPAPTTLTAALVPPSQVSSVLALVSQATLVLEDHPAVDDATLLLVPDAHGHRRTALLRTFEGRGAVVGPAKPWREARASYDRAVRVREAGWGEDSEAHLVRLVLEADADARADLRASVLAPLEGLRPGTAEKLTETLRSWLLHQGRRDEVAAALFVHPQTVRYRMGQLRELYGDRLEDPATVLALTVALG
ncbi:helix-turn-helix domain-containing protein [Nocardioides sp. CER19]|uniref:PucR family transcriptional regulator n=1 Tax=Nocardioides sp. CER19 TaxID=3038538 RepID=UPI00244BBB99|nr:helix-turn-helix domain-containing protein [Nocardioides sp. CER19]MDH2413175.1 helix-turn-helix domain-containing protein [Nocardioides sp. CER19]